MKKYQNGTPWHMRIEEVLSSIEQFQKDIKDAVDYFNKTSA